MTAFPLHWFWPIATLLTSQQSYTWLSTRRSFYPSEPQLQAWKCGFLQEMLPEHHFHPHCCSWLTYISLPSVGEVPQPGLFMLHSSCTSSQHRAHIYPDTRSPTGHHTATCSAKNFLILIMSWTVIHKKTKYPVCNNHLPLTADCQWEDKKRKETQTQMETCWHKRKEIPFIGKKKSGSLWKCECCWQLWLTSDANAVNTHHRYNHGSIFVIFRELCPLLSFLHLHPLLNFPLTPSLEHTCSKPSM